MATIHDAAAVRAFEEAEETLRRRPRLGEICFSSVRRALLWAFEQATIRNQPRSLTIHAQRDYRGEPCRVQVDGGRDQDPEEALVVVVSIMGAFNRFASMHHAQARAVTLTMRDGKSQEEAARLMNVSQQTVSRWVGECEQALAPTLREAGVLR